MKIFPKTFQRCPTTGTLAIGLMTVMMMIVSMVVAVTAQTPPISTTTLATSLPSRNHDISDSNFLFRFFNYFDNVADQLSSSCRNASDYFQLHQQDSWAIKMIDSNAVLESGLTGGNFQFLGQFDQCLQQSIPDSAMLPSTVDRSVQYCTIQFPFSVILTPNETKIFQPYILQMVPPIAGLCFSSACGRDTDLPIILSKFSNETGSAVHVTNCVTVNDLKASNRLKPRHIVIIVIYSLIVALAFLGIYIGRVVESKQRKWIHSFILCFNFERNFRFLLQTIPSKRPSPRSLAQVRQDSPPPSASPIQVTPKPTLKVVSVNLEEPIVVSECPPNSSSVAPYQSEGTVSSLETLPPSPSPLPKPKLPRPQIDCLHGIRFISFVFILLYHTFTEAQVPSANIVQIIDAERNFVKQLVTNASLWVDTFLLLSGFLVAHSMLYSGNDSDRSLTKRYLFDHPKRLLHRYLRLTPSVAGAISLSILVEALGSGPVWHQYEQESERTCHQNWWTLFLYVNNMVKLNEFFKPSRECLSYCWYLAVDMQLFLVSPLLVMLLASKNRRFRQLGIVINLVVILFSTILTGVLMAVNGLTPTVLVTVYDLDYINMVYKTSYCRIGPYCLGILLAYLLKQTVQNHQQQKQQLYDTSRWNRTIKSVLILGTAIALLLASSLLTYPWLQGADYHNFWSVLYGSVHRIVWSLGWAMIVYACVVGLCPPMDSFFGWIPFHFLSKLTYQCYLVHSILISAIINSVRQKMYYSDSNLVFDVFRYLVLTILVSIGTFVMFERPFINLEQLLLK